MHAHSDKRNEIHRWYIACSYRFHLFGQGANRIHIRSNNLRCCVSADSKHVPSGME